MMDGESNIDIISAISPYSDIIKIHVTKKMIAFRGNIVICCQLTAVFPTTNKPIIP